MTPQEKIESIINTAIQRHRIRRSLVKRQTPKHIPQKRKMDRPLRNPNEWRGAHK